MSTVIANKYLTVSEVAEHLSLTPQRVRQLIKSQQLKAEKVHDRLWVIPMTAVDKFEKTDRPTGVHVDRRE